MMKFIRTQTDEEINTQLIPQLTKVSDLPGWRSDVLWICHHCKTIFEKDDEILFRPKDEKYSDGEYCSLIYGKFFSKTCKRSLSYADVDYVKKHFLI